MKCNLGEALGLAPTSLSCCAAVLHVLLDIIEKPIDGLPVVVVFLDFRDYLEGVMGSG